MRARLTLLGMAALLAFAVTPGRAYSILGPSWPRGATVTMHLQDEGSPASSGGALIDGSGSWSAVLEAALSEWNRNLQGVSFSSVRETSRTAALGNGVNEVFWDNRIYGRDFGDALAVAFSLYDASTGAKRESDVIVDSSEHWNAYRGNLQSAGTVDWVYDLRRVALHEFGHTLGLDHPDQHGQSLLAIMNSTVSDLDRLQADDLDGARNLVFVTVPVNHPPTVTAACNPCTVRAQQSVALTAAASDADGDALTYQWTAGQGSFTAANVAATSWIAGTQVGAATVTVTVEDGHGGSASSSVTLTVSPGDRLAAGDGLRPNQRLTSSSGRYRLVFQGDGNLVLYDDRGAGAIWSTGTAAARPGQAILQADGNLVIYDSAGGVLWATGTDGNVGAVLIVQDDGNLVVYRAGGTVAWSSRS